MPTAKQIEDALFALAPKEGAMSWDNVGLLIGDPQKEILRILVALDVTEAVTEEALRRGCDLIVAHHPVMNCKWYPVQTLREDDAHGRLYRKLVREDLAVICMHTNLDVAPGGVCDVLADVLKVVDPGPLAEDGIGRCGDLADGPLPLKEFASRVCTALGCSNLRYADGGKLVRRVAVGGGACGEYWQLAIAQDCDTFVTADLSYHDFLDAAAAGLNLIDAGHFPTENGICPALLRYLQRQFPETEALLSAVHRDVIQYLF